MDYKAKNKLLFDNDNRRAKIRAAFGAGVGLSMKVRIGIVSAFSLLCCVVYGLEEI